MLGGFAETERTATIDTATSGDNTIIAAPGAGKRIYIDFVSILPTGAVTVTFKRGSTSITGPYPLDAKQSVTLENTPRLERGVMECSDNEAFVMNLGGAVQVGGFVRYRIMNE